MKLERYFFMRAIIFFLGVFSIASPIFSEHRSISFGNEHVRRTFLLRDGVWLTTEFVRLDGSEWMTVDGEEFQARLMDGRIIRLTDFKADEPKIETQGERQTLTIRYRPVKAIEAARPLSTSFTGLTNNRGFGKRSSCT